MLNNRGLFGSPRPAWMTPGINPDAPQVFDGPRLPQQPMQPPRQEQQAEKPWMDTTSGKLAMLGQILLSRGRNNPMLDVMRDRQMMQEQQRMAEQQRRAGFDDFVQRKTWERDNMPSQSSPHYWETNDGSLGMVGPDGKPQILYKDPTPKTDWIQVKDPVTGAISIVAKPIGGALPTFTAEDWDKAGGGTGNGVGGFR